MRRSVLIFFLTGFLALTAAIAQNTTPAPGNSHGYRAGGPERAFQQLNLTAGQKTQVQQLMQDQRAQMQALRANTSLTPEQRKQQIHDLRAANHQKMMSLLTPEQQAQFQQLQQQRRGRAFGGRRMQGLQALNLTEQQKDQIKPIFQSTRQQMQALRHDTSLTPEQRREKLQQIRQNQQAQLQSILTPEQQQQLQQMHRRHKVRPGNSVPPQGF